MIGLRQKYPRWWFDFNLELQRFSNRVAAYLALMDDRYPSTTHHQSGAARLRLPGRPPRAQPVAPAGEVDPRPPPRRRVGGAHGRYPRSIFEFVEGVFRSHNRVVGYAVTLVTDRYPPFRLA